MQLTNLSLAFFRLFAASLFRQFPNNVAQLANAVFDPLALARPFSGFRALGTAAFAGGPVSFAARRPVTVSFTARGVATITFTPFCIRTVAFTARRSITIPFAPLGLFAISGAALGSVAVSFGALTFGGVVALRR